MLSSEISRPLSSRMTSAAGEHQHPVAQASQFHRVRRIDHAGDPLVRFGTDGAIDIETRLGVDALGRLVDQDYLRVIEEASRQNRLLLIAAGKADDRLIKIHRGDVEFSYQGQRTARSFGAEITPPVANVLST